MNNINAHLNCNVSNERYSPTMKRKEKKEDIISLLWDTTVPKVAFICYVRIRR